ncbi:MAG: hypothetical protein R3236_02800 [Phycisphaeraceae bacterium]|nr:hypothetical protein [Phycisphaeraceae bacterium]
MSKAAQQNRSNPYEAPEARVAVRSEAVDPITPLVRIRGWFIFLGIISILHALLGAFRQALRLAEWSDPMVLLQLALGFGSVGLTAWIGVLQMQAGSCLRREWIDDDPQTVQRGSRKLALSIVLMGLLWVLTIVSVALAIAWLRSQALR